MARSQRSKRGRKNRRILRKNIYRKAEIERQWQIARAVPLERRSLFAEVRVAESKDDPRYVECRLLGDDWRKLVTPPMKRNTDGHSWKSFVVELEGQKNTNQGRTSEQHMQDELQRRAAKIENM